MDFRRATGANRGTDTPDKPGKTGKSGRADRPAKMGMTEQFGQTDRPGGIDMPKQTDRKYEPAVVRRSGGRRYNRRGSYLVEAALILPLFILALVALSLVVRISAICETIGFETAAQVKEASLHTENILYAASLCNRIEGEVKEACPALSDFRVWRANLLTLSAPMYDLMGVESRARFTVSNPIGLTGHIQYEQKVLARTFTGAVQDAAPLEASAFTDGQRAVDVLVFPKYGARFHRESCSIVTREREAGNEAVEIDKEDAERKGYTPCQLCMGSG